MAMELTIEQLAKKLDGELVGSGRAVVTAVGPLVSARPTDVTFYNNEKHREALGASQAAAVIVATPVEALDKPQIVVGDVNAALIEALRLFAPILKAPAPGVDPSAKLGQSVLLGQGVSIGANAVLADNVRIGDGTVIGSGCSIGENSTVGSHSRLDANVVVYHNCQIGSHVIIHANSTIGATGFGYSFIDGAHRLVPHNGGVVIEDYVELGANCCVDRAKFGNTIVGAGTKIDNLVQVAHNVVIGKCCLVAALAGISGSCRIGDGVVIAGQVGMADNLEIGSRATLTAKAGVMNHVSPGEVVMGVPALEYSLARRVIVHTRNLPKLVEKVKSLSKRLEQLEAAENDKKRV